MTTPQHLLADALALPPDDRESLALQLLESLRREEPYDSVWREEVMRRVAELDSGAAETIPGPQVIERLRRLAGGLDL